MNQQNPSKWVSFRSAATAKDTKIKILINEALDEDKSFPNLFISSTEPSKSNIPIETGRKSVEFESAQRLAVAGDLGSQRDLGEMYSAGRVVQQDFYRSQYWYRTAADKNFPDAQYNLGFLYYLGKGVPKNYIEALKWFILAENQKHSYAAYWRKECESKMSSSDILEAKRLASVWRPK